MPAALVPTQPRHAAAPFDTGACARCYAAVRYAPTASLAPPPPAPPPLAAPAHPLLHSAANCRQQGK